MSGDEGPHEIIAVAEVSCKTEVDEYGELVATQQLDFHVRKWICECGGSWENREEALEHYQSEITDSEQQEVDGE